MASSMTVRAYRKPDEQWRKKAAAWEACVAAGVQPPSELTDYFGGQDPTEEGASVDVGHAWSDQMGTRSVAPWAEMDGHDVMIDVRKLAETKYTHVKVSWSR